MARENFVTPLSPEEEQKKKPAPASLAGLDVDAPADAPPSQTEYSSIQARVQAMRDAAGPKTDTSGLDRADEEAKRLYDEKASRAEWLSLAEQLGRSLVRLNAANTGLKYGVDLSGVDLGKGTDWEGRTDRYAKDYTTELGRNDRGRLNARSQDKENQDLAEKAMDADSRERGVLSAEERAAKAALAADERQAAREKAAGQRQDKSLAAQEAGQSARLKQQQQFEQDREGRANKAASLRDEEHNQAEAIKMDRARESLFNNLMNEDLSGKSADKLEAEYGKLAGEAKVSLSQVKAELEKERTSRPQIFGGRSDEEDKKAQEVVKDKYLTETKNLLEGIARRKRSLLEGGTPVQSEAPVGNMVQMLRPDNGKPVNIPADKVKDAEARGYKRK